MFVCGQQDTYLNMRGAAMVLDAVKTLLGLAVDRAGDWLQSAATTLP